MPMPIASCAADVPSDVCCDTWYLIGERLRQVACAGVSACIDEDCADREFRSYQTEGPIIQDPLGDSLVVSFVRAYIRTDTRTRQQQTALRFVTRAEFRVELLENGWPNVHVDSATQTIIPPDWEMQHALAKHARGHAEKMFRSVVRAANATDQTIAMFPVASNPHIIQRGVGVGDLSPLPRPGPQIGYGMNVTVDTTLP